MSSMKGKLTRILGGGFLKTARVVEAEDIGGFRRLLLRGDVLVPKAGTKFQMLLPSDDMRTYSPVASPEGVALLGWKHAGGPGARWMSDIKVGDELRFIGPQGSLELRAGPLILVGDETSVAVAAAFEGERPGMVRAVLQAGAVEDVRRAAVAMGLRSATIIARGDTEGVVRAILSAHEELSGAAIALTGCSELIVGLRTALRASGLSDIKTKTYWVPGRAGLD